MAIFLSASDETSGSTQRDPFFRAGFVAPQSDWCDFFAPAWRERVLNGPSAIPYLHMTDIRSKQWREKYGLSRREGERRVDAAFEVIDTMGSLYPIGIRTDAGFVRDQFAASKVLLSSGAAKSFHPDFLCFLGYAYAVMLYVHKKHPEAEHVDFLVEQNGEITKHIREFHATLATGLAQLKRPGLSRLVGDLIPGGKDRIPLQAADVLCWHDARRVAGKLDAGDESRYYKIAHRWGFRWEWSNGTLTELAKVLGVNDRAIHGNHISPSRK